MTTRYLPAHIIDGKIWIDVPVPAYSLTLRDLPQLLLHASEGLPTEWPATDLPSDLAILHLRAESIGVAVMSRTFIDPHVVYVVDKWVDGPGHVLFNLRMPDLDTNLQSNLSE